MATEEEAVLKNSSEGDLKPERKEGEPTAAFKGPSRAALLIGVSSYLIGLFNAVMELNEKGYYFAVLIFGLYAAVSLQKAARDKEEGIPVTAIYYDLKSVV